MGLLKEATNKKRNDGLRTLQAKRNSSIELLRIIAMFMVLMHHFIVHNSFDISRLPFGVSKFVLYFLFSGGGKAAVVVFFAISIWFLLEGDCSLKNCLRRVWFLERELLFWSFLLLIVTFLFDMQDFGLKLLVKSLFPISMGMWWYATSYSILLVLMPFLLVGLGTLGQKGHQCLTMFIILFYGLFGLLPGSRFALGEPAFDGFVGFIFLLIIISYHKWYLKPISIKTASAFIVFGLVPILVNALICLRNPSFGINGFLYMADNWKLPVVLLGYGLFLIFRDFSFYSPFINTVAKSSFAVYLITEYQSVRSVLWTRLFSINKFNLVGFGILEVLACVLGIYVLCTVVDMLRLKVFSRTIDRNKGLWFNKFCRHLPADFLNIGSVEKVNRLQASKPTCRL